MDSIAIARDKALAVLVEIAEDKGASKEVRAHAATEILRTYDPGLSIATATCSGANANSA